MKDGNTWASSSHAFHKINLINTLGKTPASSKGDPRSFSRFFLFLYGLTGGSICVYAGITLQPISQEMQRCCDLV